MRQLFRRGVELLPVVLRREAQSLVADVEVPDTTPGQDHWYLRSRRWQAEIDPSEPQDRLAGRLRAAVRQERIFKLETEPPAELFVGEERVVVRGGFGARAFLFPASIPLGCCSCPAR